MGRHDGVPGIPRLARFAPAGSHLPSSWGPALTTQELNVIALFKGRERFIFVYDEESRDTLIDNIRDKAAEPSIPINWFDAAVLTQRIRQQEPQAAS